jgi:NAD(P)-dependent dehydrogenase (short-subunit alcohol dehydrogenase family)
MRLANKVAVITGGAGGIGEAAAARFVEEGAYVLLTDLNADALAEAAARLGSNRVSYHVGDVTSAADNQAMIDTATERYGGVDVFLANAGIEGDVASLLDYPEQRFDELMAINVKGPFLGIACSNPCDAPARGRQYYHYLQCCRSHGCSPVGALCHEQTCCYWFDEIRC